MVVWDSKQIEAAMIAVSFYAFRDLAAPARWTSFLLSGISLQKVLIDFYHSAHCSEQPFPTQSREDRYHHVDVTSSSNFFENFPDWRIRTTASIHKPCSILRSFTTVSYMKPNPYDENCFALLTHCNPCAEKNHAIPQASRYLQFQCGNLTDDKFLPCSQNKTLKGSLSRRFSSKPQG